MNFRKAKIKSKIPSTGFDAAYCEVVKTYYTSVVALIDTVIAAPLIFVNKIKAVIKQVETLIYKPVETELAFIEEQLIKIFMLREFDENIKRKQFCDAAYACGALLTALQINTGKVFVNQEEFEKWVCKNYAKAMLDNIIRTLLTEYQTKLEELRTRLEDALKLDEIIAEYNEILDTYYPNPGTEEPANVPGLVEDIVIWPNGPLNYDISWTDTKIFANNGLTYDIVSGTASCNWSAIINVMNYLVWDESSSGTNLAISATPGINDFICGYINTSWPNGDIIDITATPKTELTLNPNNPGLNFTPPISTWNGKIYDWLGLLDTFTTCFFSVCEFAATSRNKKLEYEEKLFLGEDGTPDFSGLTNGIDELQASIDKKCNDLNKQIDISLSPTPPTTVESAAEKTMNFPNPIANKKFD